MSTDVRYIKKMNSRVEINFELAGIFASLRINYSTTYADTYINIHMGTPEYDL
jgi:hypothetical protein